MISVQGISIAVLVIIFILSSVAVCVVIFSPEEQGPRVQGPRYQGTGWAGLAQPNKSDLPRPPKNTSLGQHFYYVGNLHIEFM